MKFLKNVLIIVTALFIIDIICGFLGDYIINKTHEKNYVGDAALLNYNLNAVSSDVVIVGSSTALCHYVPSIIRDSLSQCYGTPIEVFNAGASTQGIAYDYAVVSSIIERQTPSLIIMDLQYKDFVSGFSAEQQSTLKAYYGYNKYITDIFNNHCSYKERMPLNCNMYRLNTTISRLAFSFFKPIGSDGFYPHDGVLETEPSLIVEKTYPQFDEVTIAEFEKIVQLCENRGVKIVVFFSPYYKHQYADESLMTSVQNKLSELGLDYFDYIHDKQFQKSTLFFDQRHMNIDGANLYSKEVCSVIRNLFGEVK